MRTHASGSVATSAIRWRRCARRVGVKHTAAPCAVPLPRGSLGDASCCRGSRHAMQDSLTARGRSTCVDGLGRLNQPQGGTPDHQGLLNGNKRGGAQRRVRHGPEREPCLHRGISEAERTAEGQPFTHIGRRLVATCRSDINRSGAVRLDAKRPWSRRFHPRTVHHSAEPDVFLSVSSIRRLLTRTGHGYDVDVRPLPRHIAIDKKRAVGRRDG